MSIPLPYFRSESCLNVFIEELEDTPIYKELQTIQNMWFFTSEELIENKVDIICHNDCESMEDVAAYYVEETG